MSAMSVKPKPDGCPNADIARKSLALGHYSHSKQCSIIFLGIENLEHVLGVNSFIQTKYMHLIGFTLTPTCFGAQFLPAVATYMYGSENFTWALKILKCHLSKLSLYEIARSKL